MSQPGVPVGVNPNQLACCSVPLTICHLPTLYVDNGCRQDNLADCVEPRHRMRCTGCNGVFIHTVCFMYQMHLEICFPLTIWTWDWMAPLVEFVGGHGPWPWSSELLDIMSCAWIRSAISIWFVFEVNILRTVWCLCVKFGDWRSFAHLCPWTQLWPSDFKVKLFFSWF